MQKKNSSGTFSEKKEEIQAASFKALAHYLSSEGSNIERID
jgi:hypothetical protein